MNPPHDQDIVLFLDFANRLRDEATFPRSNLARLQRAPEGAGQSTGGGGHEIVKRRGVRVRLGGTDAIVGGDLRMDAKKHRLALCRQIRPAERPFDTLDAHEGTVDDRIVHGLSSNQEQGLNE
jgi:hypothetical protein